MPADWTIVRREYRGFLGAMLSWPDVIAAAMSGSVVMEPGVGACYSSLHKGWDDVLNKAGNTQMSAHEATAMIIEHTQMTLAGDK